MNIAALILAIIAVALFVAAYLKVNRRWADVSLGLAFLATAWIVQSIWDTSHIVHGHL